MEMHSSAAAGWRSPAFTAAQWAELEKQALIYKHFMAGIPVPPELLPIRRSFFHFPSLSYPSYYAKKLDPEPGRCRRTDGKKWRCSKDAHPDSKYCERHMHRSRKRSRKPVETQALSQSWSSSSMVTSLSPPVSSGSQSGSRSFQSFPLNSASGGSIVQDSCNSQSCGPLLNIDSRSYGLNNKEYRYQHGGRAQLDDHSLFAEASGSTKGIGMEQDSPWSLLPSQLSSFSLSKASDSLMQGSYLQLQPAQDLRQATINPRSIGSQQQQHSFFEGEFGASATVRHESQLLRPLFDDWTKRDSWSGFGDDGSSQTSLSTTQLSISIPMPSTEFSRCSRSSNVPSPYKESLQ